MPFAHLLKTRDSLESFRIKYNVPHNIENSYSYEGDIEDKRLCHIVFFLLVSILEGGVRFPVDPMLLRTLSILALAPTSVCPTFIG